MSYFIHLLIYFEIFAIVALSLNLLIGYGGLLQVAHAAYYGIGAYTAALIWARFDVGFLPGMGAAMGAAAALSLLVSLPAWRFRGDYFVLASLAVQSCVYTVLHNWTDVTNGPFGIAGIDRPVIGSYVFESSGSILVLYAAIALAFGSALAVVKAAPFGRSMRAMRDDEHAAKSLGIPVRRLKLKAFALASAGVGLAGAMYASYASFIDSSSFSLHESILMLSMVIVGGTGNVRGPLVGAATLIVVPEVLRFVSLPDAVAANARALVYGLLLMVMMHVRPQGLAGNYRYE